MKNIVFLTFLLPFIVKAQEFTRADTLKGSITPERAWWDVMHYDLAVEIFPETKQISGRNTIIYKVIASHTTMQIDLQSPMRIDSIIQNNKKLTFQSEGNVHFVNVRQQLIGSKNELDIYFSGMPRVARRPPWDGGFVWTKDSNQNYWIANANQGIGASVWWPLKDHPYDEPDEGMRISVTVPKDLMNVSNGQLKAVQEHETTKTWIWEVVNPINAYGVNISIGDYVHFEEIYQGENGLLKMDYYVLRDHKEKAKKQFQQAPLMMEAFEYWFGPYPFYEDGYKLIEVPYLGMEHQSAVTYGNKFTNGYLGKDLSESGHGLKFDFILIHESAHEWFANNITNNDVAYMWIHEGFTCYSESLYLDYHFGKKAASEYVVGLRKRIMNDRPMIAVPNVNFRGSSDIYYKGANVLHTLRQVINNDQKWRSILRGLNETFYHQTISSKQLEDYISEQLNCDLSPFWNQYLRTTKIPTLEYKIDGKKLRYRYTSVVENFEMPVLVTINKKEKWLRPTKEWKTLKVGKPIENFSVKEDFYIHINPTEP